jgi:hypothetical protein
MEGIGETQKHLIKSFAGSRKPPKFHHMISVHDENGDLKKATNTTFDRVYVVCG